ncbi:MAG: glycosyltransferase family 4 protein [Legionellaceae bacterium]|nr:glycosyltransferase family 4 protein [Legionellaceae bacterium]
MRVKKIALVSYGYLTADPRILTIADSLKSHGWDVIGINIHPRALSHTNTTRLFKRHTCYNLQAKSFARVWVLIAKLLARGLKLFGCQSQGELLYFKAIHTYIKKAVQKADFQKLTKDVDVFYGCEMFFGAFIAYHATTDSNKAFVFDIKELYSDMTAQLSGKLKQFVLRHEALFIERSRLFPCVSNGIGDHYSALHPLFQKKSYVLLPNTPSQLPEAKRALRDNTKPIRFVMIAGFAPNIRGIELLIKLWAAVLPLQATLDLYLSHLSDADKKVLLKLAGTAAGRSLQIKPPIKVDNIVEMLADYDVGVIPYLPDACLNHKYCCPGKFGQYLKAGLAVLSSDTSHITQYIQAFDLGAVYPTNNFAESVAVFQELLRHPERIDVMKQNAGYFFDQEYHWDVFAKRFLDAMDEVLT